MIMLKKLVSLLLMCGVFALPGSVFGQSEALQNNANSKPNLRQFFSEETAKIKSAGTDFKKLDREKMKSVSKSKWTNTQKTLLWAGIGAAVAATVIIVIASRNNDSAEENCFATCTAVGCSPALPCVR
jgi:uncharacterized membrane protein YraQ (UPF0718 family)